MANYKTYTAGTYADSDELKKSKQNADHWNEQQFKEFTYDDFKDSDRTTGYLNQLDNLQGPGDFSFSKQQGWDNIMNQILNREKFTYDVNGDALYQQYKDQYVNQGKMAMMDTMGQAAAMTGGYGNSYAQSVGQQAYQGYLQQLTDKIPELYQLAMSKYQMEGDELYNQYSLYSDQYNTEYGQHRDAVSDYQADRSHLGDMWSASHAVDMDTYTANRDTAKAEVDSYNSIISENRQTWNDIVTDLRNSEWGKYVDKETLAQKAVDIYNDTVYKNVQEQQAAAELAEKKRANTVSAIQARDQLNEQRRQFNKNFEASTGYTVDGQKSSTFTKEEDDDFQPYTFARTDAYGNNVFYRDGKEYTFEKGVNPYTGKKNPDAKNGTFSNGYQPNNVNGKKLEKTGQTDVVNGVTQNVWKTPDGTKYIWDGTKNAYLRYQD